MRDRTREYNKYEILLFTNEQSRESPSYFTVYSRDIYKLKNIEQLLRNLTAKMKNEDMFFVVDDIVFVDSRNIQERFVKEHPEFVSTIPVHNHYGLELVLNSDDFSWY